MKLVYIYFDFTIGGNNPEGYRGYQKCGLNFGTDYYFEMSEPNDDNPDYVLRCTPRPVGERIEPGFWGDAHLYNISALVGDNGAGKSTIIHEIIRCLLGGSLNGNTRNSLFAILMQEDNGEYYLDYSLSKPIKVRIDAAAETNFDVDLLRLSNSSNLVSPSIHFSNESSQAGQSNMPPILNSVKLIYFSNALTLSDKRLFEAFTEPYFDSYCEHDESWNPLYTRPFYDCSLVADMAAAMKTSGVFESSINQHLETYFNFRSYQEARYVFDRNQRKILLEMKDKYGFPVPLPSCLTLQISPAFPRLYSLFLNENHLPRTSNTNAFNCFRDEYRKHFRDCSDTEALITELCINCIACFGGYVAEYWGKRYIQPEPPIANFGDQQFYSDFLKSICPDSIENSARDMNETQDYYDNCCAYIDLLWNNYDNIEAFFITSKKRKDKSINFVECSISLRREIDIVLTEFMIRFINLTRAVSKMSYFVIYNWGLSSGESNLLHMFTKLRYLLLGNPYDQNTSTDKVTNENAGTTLLAERTESLINHIPQQDIMACNSVILFLDEADLTLHPDWQRQFVAILAVFLPKIFIDSGHNNPALCCRNIQIILGTHSPIMLGDFPAGSVIYLQKKDGTATVNDHSLLQTFGQNIYTILKDGFYLKNGTLGELARRKIQEVLDATKAIQNCEWTETYTAQECMEQLDNYQKMTVQYLPNGIIKNKLAEEISICKKMLEDSLPPESRVPIAKDGNAARIKKLEQENEELRRQLKKLRGKEDSQ